MQNITIIEHLVSTNLSQKIIIFLGIVLIFFHHWILKLWKQTWPWTFMDKKCTYVWNAHKWKNWTVRKHVYFLWCIIVIKPITKCTTTSTHVNVRKKPCYLYISSPIGSYAWKKIKLNLFKWMGIIHFHNNTSIHKQTKYFNLWKIFKKMLIHHFLNI